MVHGSCLCGGVRFEADAVALLIHCHCATCRKTSGAAFGSFALVDRARFRFTAGEALVVAYESSPGSHRHFCRVCGSRAPGAPPHLPWASIPAGTLDDDPGVRPSLHVWTSSTAPWWEIADGLPRHERWVPGFEPAWAKEAR